MEDFKALLASRTVWAGLIGLVASVLGIVLSPEDASSLSVLATQVVTAVSAIGAIVFRLAATARIK